MREQIVLPLLTIQQYASTQIHQLKNHPEVNEQLIRVYEKLVTRSLFGNTNASRNSA
jgi:phosphoenolpyruvate carboxylase